MNDYLDFLERKRHSIGDFGFDPVWMPEGAFDFQEFIIEKLIRKGRIANFSDTGLGKTLMQLSFAQNVILKTNKRVLILTPLAVAFQFILEAERIGIDDIEYSKDGHFTKKIVICNYERLHYFNESDFVCVIGDESGILKNFDGKIKGQINSFLRKTPYRLLSTATPSPNDFIELGNHSEALGYMGYMDMLTKFFKNNQNSIDSTNRNIGEKFYLKPHAEKSFFAWVAQWSVICKMPSDLGFSNDRYILPELIINKHTVQNKSNLTASGQLMFFTPIAKSMTEVKFEQKQTIEDRCIKAVELASDHDLSFIWVNYNEEGELVEKLLPNSVNIQGSDSYDKKELAVQWFLGKECICDSKHFGLNWQKKKICGNQNTPNEGEKNIKVILQREKDEKLNADLLKKIRSTWQSIIKLTQQNSSTKTLLSEIENGESIIKTILSIEKSVREAQLSTQEKIQIKDINDLLSRMELLLKDIIKSLNNRIINVRYALSILTQVIENQWLLTIAIQQIKLEEYCVPVAILDSDILKTINNPSQMQSCTCGHASGVRRLISKSKIFGMGLNFQHCNHTVFFPTFSYEQYYQSLRRFWRFGQTRDVIVDLIISDGQQRVLDAIQQKSDKAIQLHENLTRNVNGVFEDIRKEFNKEIITPKFL